jgi:hypothetical protein
MNRRSAPMAEPMSSMIVKESTAKKVPGSNATDVVAHEINTLLAQEEGKEE